MYQMYGYSTQLIEWYTVYNTQVSGDRIIGKTKYIFYKERPSFFYGKTTNKSGNTPYYVMSRERSFIQMLREGKTFKTLPQGIDKNILIDLAKQYASKSIISVVNNLCL